jgi:4-hydroxy-2-oxoheptanedioate aldolase
MCTTVRSGPMEGPESSTDCLPNEGFDLLACRHGIELTRQRSSWAPNTGDSAPHLRIAKSCWLPRDLMADNSGPGQNGRVAAGQSGSRGFGGVSSGVWCNDASAGMAVRLAGLGFDWVCLDMQHGRYSRNDIIDVARGFPSGLPQLVVRVPSCDFTAIGGALDAGARAVIVPQVESATQARRAVSATFYPPVGYRSWGPLSRIWGGKTLTADEANSSVTCAVMIESAAALMAVEEIAATPGVGQLFVGPYDLSLSLGTSVPALLDDDSDASPLARIVQTAAAYGLSVGGFAGTPEIAMRFRERGITCVAVATDLWITAEGARTALR